MVAGRPSKQVQILAAARHLFSEFGYQGTSIDLVVQRAGVSKPTVYNHFATKQILLQHLLDQLAQEAMQYRAKLESRYKPGSVNGLAATFRYIAETPAHLASYRILAGERFKLSAELIACIRQLESQHLGWCEQWLGDTVDAHNRQLIIALCRNSIVYPALMGDQIVSDQVLRKRLLKLV